ncbi:MAG: hypothetical protein ACK4NY_21170 [Spirosomataceae bacterium]
MKRFFLSFILSVIGLYASAQGTIQLTVRWNTTANRYEVFARPSFTLNNFNWGPSQISVVVPNSAPDASFTITSIAAGAWSDNSKVYAPPALSTSDFHGVESNGAPINLTANTESLIFAFTFPDGQCRDGIRLFVNNVDPGSSAAGMSGGDFRNSISNALLEDVYLSNYNNTGTLCNPCIIVAPELIK